MSSAEDDLRELTHEDPESVRRVAKIAGGPIEKRLKRLMREEGVLD